MTKDLRPGARVAIAAGSRGIAEIATIVRVLVASLRRQGVIIPAMGNPGGATSEIEVVGAPLPFPLEADSSLTPFARLIHNLAFP